MDINTLNDPGLFCSALFEKMKSIAPVVETMALYEFRYSLNNCTPENNNWQAVELKSKKEIEVEISSPEFFKNIAIKPKVDNKIVLDPVINTYTQMLFKGLVTGDYDAEWIRKYFYFDPRSFNFYVRSTYLTESIRKHLGGTPYQQFEQKQLAFERVHEVGYRDFMTANAEVDACFIDFVWRLVERKGSPIILAIAGPTAAGKTEIVERLTERFAQNGKQTASIELDNYLTDRDQREERGIGSFGKAALHFELFQADIRAIMRGERIFTPRYDFIDGTSSHDLQGNLKPNRKPVEISPADIIFLEGNSPFLLPEIAPLIGIKIVYLTDDPVRLKRKWRRDVDYRKKYDPYYLRNRFFCEQPPMAVKNYQPQLLICDLFVNTTEAAIWVTPEIQELLNK
jgi:uridine kinase